MRKNVALSGVSRIPGGATSGDGELSMAVNVANDGNGLQLLEKPDVLFSLEDNEELLCVHTPEGEDKHYITQMVVEEATQQSANQLRGGDSDTPSQDPEPSDDSNLVPETPSEPIEPFDPEPEIVVPDEPVEQDPSNPNPTIDPYEPLTPEEAEIYEDVVTKERFERESDNGGTVITSQGGGGGGVEPPAEEGIYLVWREDNGDGTSTIKQMIDITSFGKVTNIQAMGNTLVCNHEGGTATITETTLGQTTTTEVTYPPELRYYLFKKEKDGEPLNLYLPLGAKPPFLKIRFGLKSKFEWYPKTESTFNNNSTPTKYKKYGGVTTYAQAYTDTIPVYLGDDDDDDADKNWWWPPEVYYLIQEAEPEFEMFSHWQPTYSVEGVESPDGKTDVAGIKNQWTTNILASYNKFIYEQQKDNKFVFPFFVRYAYELYDGSLIMHSYPVLMIPNSRGPIFALDGWQGICAGLKHGGQEYEKTRITTHGRTFGFASKLMHQITKLTDAEYERLEYWQDLIRGISIYITPPMYNYKQSGQVFGWHSMSSQDPANNNADPWEKYYTVGKIVDANDTTITSGETKMDYAFANLINNNNIFKPFGTVNGTDYDTPSYCMTVPQKEDKEITEMHESAGQFFKLATIDYDDMLKYAKNGMVDSEVEIRNKALNTITARQLMQDDNGSHDKMSADVMYGYNRRLNMAATKRVMHPPLPLETQWAHDYSTGKVYHEIVYANNHGERAQLYTTSSNVGVTWPKFIFYPGTDARDVYIYRGGQSVKYHIKLKEHKFLNGMFWIADFTNKADSITDHVSTKTMEFVAENVNTTVDEGDKIYTSETDNPFVVPIGNINIAGGGKVRALCAATQAMSTAQFGQHPMYCFTSEGVWAMTVNETGGWGTVQPMTRDVIGLNSKPLSLDSTVIFLTERGLIQLAGSEVAILSEMLSTTDTTLDLNNFAALATKLDELCDIDVTSKDSYSMMRAKAVVAAASHFPMGDACLGYDSDNQRIYVTPNGEQFSWVFNIKTKLWTQATTHIDKQIPTYPELVTQQGSDVVLVSVDGGVPSKRYGDGLIVTRPIKMEDMGVLKKWREMMLRGQFKNYQTTPPMVMSALWGSRNWHDYALVASSRGSRITRWTGSPYFGHVVLVAMHGNNEYNIQVNGIDAEIDVEQINKLR